MMERKLIELYLYLDVLGKLDDFVKEVKKEQMWRKVTRNSVINSLILLGIKKHKEDQGK
jgi:hypothetical protein